MLCLPINLGLGSSPVSPTWYVWSFTLPFNREVTSPANHHGHSVGGIVDNSAMIGQGSVDDAKKKNRPTDMGVDGKIRTHCPSTWIPSLTRPPASVLKTEEKAPWGQGVLCAFCNFCLIFLEHDGKTLGCASGFSRTRECIAILDAVRDSTMSTLMQVVWKGTMLAEV